MQTASRQIAQQITNEDLFLPDCGLSYLEVEGGRGGGRGGGGGGAAETLATSGNFQDLPPPPSPPPSPPSRVYKPQQNL